MPNMATDAPVKSLVLTAFDRFGDYLSNPTQTIADELDGKSLAGYSIKSLVLRCEISNEDRGTLVFETARELEARGIVCLGLASDKTGLCIESRSRNSINNHKYCPPEINGTPVESDTPYDSVHEIDLSAWNFGSFKQSCAEEEIAVMEISDDPGGFCCNQLLHQLSRAKSLEIEHCSPQFIFIHIPCSNESVPDIEKFMATGKTLMPIKKVIRGLEILLETASL